MIKSEFIIQLTGIPACMLKRRSITTYLVPKLERAGRARAARATARAIRALYFTPPRTMTRNPPATRATGDEP